MLLRFHFPCPTRTANRAMRQSQSRSTSWPASPTWSEWGISAGRRTSTPAFISVLILLFPMDRSRFIVSATTRPLCWPFISPMVRRQISRLPKGSWRCLNTGFINYTAGSVRVPTTSCNSTAKKSTAANRVANRSSRTSRYNPANATSSRSPVSKARRQGSGCRRWISWETVTSRRWPSGQESSPGWSTGTASGRFATMFTSRRRGWRRTARARR